MKKILKNVRGTKDILPDESYKWQYVEQRIRNAPKAAPSFAPNSGVISILEIPLTLDF